MKTSKFKKPIEKLFSLADVRINGDQPWDLQVHNESFYQRVLKQGSLGLGESYMDGLWDCKQLDDFFCRILRANLDEKIISNDIIISIIASKIFNLQTKKRSTQVAKQHYDLGNEFYKNMLDERMQYTCAYWKQANNLNQAQENKLDLICQKLDLKSGDRVLELGCGWGGFAKYAAEKYGCSVKAYNISKEQVEYARACCQGLPVEIVQRDYREAGGTFDKVAAIGIMEHVGPKNYRQLITIAHRCLVDNGLFLLHTIGRNTSMTISDPWINKYIFPGSILPSANQISKAFEDLFVLEDWHSFGPDYDKTLMEWYKNTERNGSKIKSHFDERFYRMWKYYLLCCAGSFRARKNQLWQIVLSKNGIPGGYQSIR